jgi:hypothetical protein
MAAVSRRDSLAIGSRYSPRESCGFSVQLAKDPDRRDLDDISSLHAYENKKPEQWSAPALMHCFPILRSRQFIPP